MIDRKQLHRLVDQLPEEKLPRLNDIFLNIFDEEKSELNYKAKKEIDEARKRIKDGDYISLDELIV